MKSSPQRDILAHYARRLQQVDPIVQIGRIYQIIGMIMESVGPRVSLGDLCTIRPKNGQKEGRAEVVGFRENKILLMPLNDISGYSPGSEVIATNEDLSVGVGEGLLGRILNGLGEPIDDNGPVDVSEKRSIYQVPSNPLSRPPISRSIGTGVKAIDGLITLGQGQRMGIFAGSGVGKSVLLGMIARNTSADVNVIALIGERGREVREFIERDLGEDGLRRSVVVAATSDSSPLVRIKGAFSATTIAEYFRDQGLNVLLMMDSVTRVAMAQREIGLAVGEPPATKGYTPSTFTLLPRLLERAGNFAGGSITGLYTVLVEGDDLNDPIADSARSILDGHIVLSRDLANRGHYPAIDPLQSISRVMSEVVEEDHLKKAREFLNLLAVYREAEDLINIGAYVKGSNPKIDRAIEKIDELNKFLQQDVNEQNTFDQIVDDLFSII